MTSASNTGSWQWADLVGALNETLDLAKKRAVEPAFLDPTAYSRFLPATVTASTTYGITIATALTAANGAIEQSCKENRMPSALSVGDISVALRERLFPAITTWNRLEARPRSQTFDRALQAEIRDALWMLTKQWQMGEFRGSDAGSPVFAKLLLATTRLTKYRPAGGTAQLFDSSTPLETKVERRPVPMQRQSRIISLDLRLVMARQWFALIADVAESTASQLHSCLSNRQARSHAEPECRCLLAS